MPSPRNQTIVQSIARLARQASKAGQTLQPSDEAHRLLAQYPECGWSVQEIADEITRRTLEIGGAVEI